MRFFAILLVVLVAGFGWALWQGIDLATGWVAELDLPPPDGMAPEQVEFTSADQELASSETTLEIEETLATSGLATGPVGTITPLEVGQDASSEVPAELDAAASTGTPVRDTTQAALGPDVAAAGPTNPAPTAGEPAEPDPVSQPAATTVVAEELASDPERSSPDISPGSITVDTAVGAAVETAPQISVPASRDTAPETDLVEPESSAAPDPAQEIPAVEPAAIVAAADESIQPDGTDAPQCNIEACAAAFQSFRASDCTYQPFEGPRQICTKGSRAPDPLKAEAITQPVQVEGPQCDVQRCTEAYRSFRASDCTYQPFEGSRQLCPY